MDSVLTSMVEESFDINSELRKKLKSKMEREYFFFLRDIELGFNVLINQISNQGKKEVIISALAPSYVYETLVRLDFNPIVIDVEPETGVFSIEDVEKKITENTAFIVNNSVYGVLFPTSSLIELGIQVIELITSGFGVSEPGVIYGSEADYSIISMEESDIVSALGGAVLTLNKKSTAEDIDDYLKVKKHTILSRLNASFAMSQFSDIENLFEKKRSLVSVYKDSVIKSGYRTLENSEFNSYNLFPVVLKRGLKDIQKYCRKQGIETDKAFRGTIVQEIDNIKCSNAKSLSNKTILFPMNLGLNKSSITLILKILSTLP